MRTLVLALFATLAAGCGGEAPEKPAAPAPAPAPSSEFALPVTAPMQARERMLHDIGRQNQKARDRRSTIDEMFNRNR